MADENLGKYSISVEVESSGASKGINDAVSSITSATDKMVGSMTSMTSNIDTSMKKAADSTKTAANNMNSSMQSAMSGISGAVDKLKGILGGIGIGIVTAFGGATKAALDYEKSLAGLSRTSGLTTEAASKLTYASNYYGVSSEDLGRNIGILSRNLVNLEKNSDSATNVFNRFKIETGDATGKLLPTDQILNNVADRFKSMPNGVEKTGLAMQLFGRSGQQMIPMLNQGSEGLKKMGVDAGKLGLVMSDLSALQAYNAAQKQWTATMKGLDIQLGQVTLPIMTALANAISSLLQAFNSIDAGTRSSIISFVAVVGGVSALTFGFSALTAILGTLGGPFAALATRLTALPSLVTMVSTSISMLGKGAVGVFSGLLNPIGLFNSAMAMSGTVATVTRGMVGTMTAAFSLLPAALAGGRAGMVAWAGACGLTTTVANIANFAMKALYLTLGFGIVAIAALAGAWYFNVGGIKEATAGFVESVSSSFSNLWTSLKAIGSGIADMFGGIWKAATGDFAGGVAQIKGSLDVMSNAATGVRTAIASIGSGILNGGLAGASALYNSAKGALGLGDDKPAPLLGGPEGAPDFSAGNVPDKDKVGKGEDQSAYEIAKQEYEKIAALEDADNKRKLELWQQYLANVEKTTKEAGEYQIELAKLTTSAKKEQLEIDHALLEKEIAQGKANTQEAFDKKIALLQREVQLTKDGSVDRIKAETAVINAQKDQAKLLQEIDNEILSRQRQMNQEKIDMDDALNNILLDNGKISEVQYSQFMIESEEKRYQDKLNTLQKELAANKENQLKMEAIETQIDALTAQHKLKRLQMDNDLKNKMNANMNELKNATSSAMSSAAQGLLKGSSTLLGAINSIVTSMKNNILKQFSDDWAIKLSGKIFKTTNSSSGKKTADVAEAMTTQTAITAAAQAGATTRNAIKQTEVATNTAASTTQITTTSTTEAATTGIVVAGEATKATASAASGAAATASSAAALQAMLPILAILMLIGALTGGGDSTSTSSSAVSLGRSPTSYYSAPSSVSSISVPSFDVGTLDVPNDMLAQVHKGEVIVPETFADGVRGMIGGNNSSSSSNRQQQRTSININASAIDGRGMKQAFDSSSRDMANTLKKEYRRFNK